MVICKYVKRSVQHNVIITAGQVTRTECMGVNTDLKSSCISVNTPTLETWFTQSKGGRLEKSGVNPTDRGPD